MYDANYYTGKKDKVNQKRQETVQKFIDTAINIMRQNAVMADEFVKELMYLQEQITEITKEEEESKKMVSQPSEKVDKK